MISFDLECKNGHCFEGWFEDGEAFEQQQKKGLLTCPVCNNQIIYKIPSTFGIKKSSAADQKPVSLSDLNKKIENASKFVKQFVETNFEDVGTNFAKEALNIHYGLKEPKNIRGVSTKEEEKILDEEGIKFIKIPRISDINDTETN